MRECVNHILDGLKLNCLHEGYDIRPIPHTNGAYGVYNGDDLLVSADSRPEAEEELRELEKEDSKLSSYKVSYTFVDRDDSVRYKDIVLKARSESEVKSSSEYKKLYRDRMVHDIRIQRI